VRARCWPDGENEVSDFPAAEARRVARLDAQAAALLGVFARRDYAHADPPVLQPADIFLDRSGEEIRRRTFFLTDPAGRELCLRPELTIPVCRQHLERGGGFPARIAYHGPAFRMRSNDPEGSGQFLQTGVEYLGADNCDESDAEVLSLAVEGLRAAGLEIFSAQIGDASLFPRLIDALPVPAPWRGRLKRHFKRPESFAALLRRLSSGQVAPGAAYLAQIGAAGEEEARAALSGLLDLPGGAGSREVFAGRTREEIIDRLMEQAAEAASLRLDRNALSAIEAALAISGHAEKSLGELVALLKTHGVSLEAPLETMAARIAGLRKLGLSDGQVSFAPRFGRNMDYYTGFVFELWARDADGPVQVAGGGRYDTLLKTLGAARDIPAVGCAIRDERVLAARDFLAGAS
jgi:ATP phosphoribosyltransferase regulatory subunit